LGVRSCNAQNRAAEDCDLIGKRRRDAVDAEELVTVFDEIEVVERWFFFDYDGYVFYEFRETIRQLVECFGDELPEFIRLDYQPGRMLKP